ncbi:PHD-type domain-containing protein [Citrus sinensis]|uniref:PHD-type domain-containing protein n=1 Tax=Citrus sinensis TaxID=2711 RepID=A0ACB8ITR7_CITSI|nr:PHD-type domain-containing protein [Citrus sinensis]
MANGTDSEEKFVVLSKIRVGLKREFEFALKVQSEICGSLGRTRARKVQSNVDSGCVLGPPEVKKLKTYESRKKRKRQEQSVVVKETEDKREEEVKSDVFDVNNERERPIREKESKDDSENMGVGEKGALMNVEEVKVVSERREEGNDEFGKVVIGVEEEKKNECDEVLMNVEENKYGELDGMGGSDRIEEEKNECGEPVVVVEEERRNECNKVLTNVEENEHSEVDREKAENDLIGEVKNEFEEVVAVVEEEKKDESDRVAMDVEEVKCEEVGLGKEYEPGRVQMEMDEEKKNDIERELVENGVLESSMVGKHSSTLCNGESNVAKSVVVDGNDEGKTVNVVVERPLRRFTRSLLQQKVELAKGSLSKDGGKRSDVTEVANDGVGGPVKQETVMKPRKVMRKFYSKLKNFLESGILEGMSVMYIRGSKVKGPGVTGLRGVVKGSGISCFCDDCKGNQVVTPAVFELHAGSSNKRPPEYIYLENGKTLRDIMNVCKDSPLETLEKAVRMVLGSSSMKKANFCLNCRVSFSNAGVEELMLLCKSCVELKESQAGSAEIKEPLSHSSEMEPQPPSVELEESPAPSGELTDTSNRSPEPNSAQTSSHSKMKSSSVKSHGKITRKDLRMHKLVFEEGGLEDGAEVGYFVRGEATKRDLEYCAPAATLRSAPHSLKLMLVGQVVVNREFLSFGEIFSGMYEGNPYVKGIISLPVYCVSLPGIPSGTWHCRYCMNTFQKEKFVEYNANARAAGRIEGVDPFAQMVSRCIRIVQTPDTELGGCVLCRGRDFCKSRFGRRTVILCDQCEREYHVGCLKDHGMEDLQELPKGKWLCCADCKRINLALQKLVDRGEEKLPETSLDVIKKKHEESGSDNAVDFDVRWRVLRGKKVDASDGTRALLSKAVSIFHDRFDPIIESASKLDLIPAMVYGRSHRGQDYHGMYCAILTVNQVVVSAGIFRIFGQELAELPLVATSNDCQGQGYFQSLFCCIEKLLGFLNVKTLVLPSASEAQAIWTNKFGFSMMTEEEQNKYRNDYPLMIFQGTSMLQKPVPKCRIVGKSVDG